MSKLITWQIATGHFFIILNTNWQIWRCISDTCTFHKDYKWHPLTSQNILTIKRNIIFNLQLKLNGINYFNPKIMTKLTDKPILIWNHFKKQQYHYDHISTQSSIQTRGSWGLNHSPEFRPAWEQAYVSSLNYRHMWDCRIWQPRRCSNSSPI